MSLRACQIGHDFNNCLGIMAGRAELALMEIDRGNDEKARRSMTVVLDQIAKMNALVESLRRLREEADGMEVPSPPPSRTSTRPS